MSGLNYNHLYYFWSAVRDGGIQAAAKRLGLTHPTLSVQIQRLERQLGSELLHRDGRRIRLSERGKVAYRYADQIFRLGQEFVDIMHGHDVGGRRPLRVGITDAMPTLIVRGLLEPVLDLDEPIQLILQHDRGDRLLAELAIHNLQVVLADAPCPPSHGIQAFNHNLGASGLSFFAHPDIASQLRGEFPNCMDGQPFLAPAATTALGRNLDQWLHKHEIYPDVVAEFEDSALLKTFGAMATGIFVVPTVIETEVANAYGVSVIGRTDQIVEEFFAITLEPRPKDIAIKAICAEARTHLFAS